MIWPRPGLTRSADTLKSKGEGEGGSLWVVASARGRFGLEGGAGGGTSVEKGTL